MIEQSLRNANVFNLGKQRPRSSKMNFSQYVLQDYVLLKLTDTLTEPIWFKKLPFVHKYSLVIHLGKYFDSETKNHPEKFMFCFYASSFLSFFWVLGWELGKFKNCWNKSFRTSEILTLLYQQFSNLLISQRNMSGPRLGELSNDRWSGGTLRT
jgi:hypothetical protein